MKDSEVMNELSYEKLLVINSIRFTPREVDVLSCLLKAMSTKKIAGFLPIATQTVRNHVQNIMAKIGCNSRYNIIEFVERSQNLPLLKGHYSTLFFKASFIKSLKEISKTKREAEFSCKLIYWTETNASQSLMSNIQAHLKLAGISTDLELRKNTPILSELMKEAQKDHYEIYILPKVLIENLKEGPAVKDKDFNLLGGKNSSLRRLFLFSGHCPSLEACDKERPSLFLNLESQENYFFAFFTLLSGLFPTLGMEKIVAEFKDTYKKEQIDYKSPQTLLKNTASRHPMYHRWGHVVCYVHSQG